jgi:hypothetical protein
MFSLSEVSYLVHTKYVGHHYNLTQWMEVGHYWYTIHGSPKRGYNHNGILLEEVYQGRYVKLDSSETVVG